ncbi:MAG: hypothetical protein ACNJA3_27480 (plasmid) [Pseudomonas rhizophila]|uniref:hypothetical protein n=1 Tax=Pseudomonas rhizophila TaxID=2045200 RepID=UPI003F6C4194
MPSISKSAIQAVRDYVIDNNGGRLETDYFGHQVIAAAEAHLVTVERQSSPPIPLLEFFERPDDMGQGRLRMIMDGDADVIIEVISIEGESLALEFCTSVTGGGRSPKVREALYNLMNAICDENETNPIFTGK